MKWNTLSKVLTYLAICIISFILVFPVYWVIIPSFKPTKEMFSWPPKLYPEHLTLEHYIKLFTYYPETVTIDMPLYIRNSLLVCISASIINMLISIPAGYALARLTFKGKNTYKTTILLTQMMPAVLFFVPIYLLFKHFGLINNLVSLVIVYPALVAPFSIIVSEAYISSIPREIEESALIDGAGLGSIIFRIIFPLSRPLMVALFTYSLIWTWNDLVIALVLCHANEVRTASVGLYSFIGSATIEWGGLLAGCTLCMLPPLLLFAVFQKYLIKGITAGAIKI